jgi:hypothetical protein
MTTKIKSNVFLFGLIMLFLSISCKTPEPHGLPEKWFVAGSHPTSYKFGTDNTISKTGDYSAIIKSSTDKITGFGTLMQQCSPDKFIGKRVKFSGYMKSENVSDWAGLWVRIDVDTVMVSFDNMHDGKKNISVKGSSDWKKYEIVLDVPSNSTLISYGALLSGTGQIWFDNLTFEVVDNNVETTGITNSCDIQNGRKPKDQMAEPFNLDFEK